MFQSSRTQGTWRNFYSVSLAARAHKILNSKTSRHPDSVMLRIQDFEFVRVVGTGAFGRVYLARLKSGPKTAFAVKMLRLRKLLRQRLADQLENEISILRRLYGCPFVTRLFSTDFDDGRVGLVLEYVSGGELFYWLKKFGRFSEQMTRFYAAEMVCALGFIHGKGILYRDLKPENILIGSDGHIKFIDFGFAVYENESTYVISGTPEYMSPEKLKSEDDGRESDYWGLGIIIYEMLCGNPPFYDLNTDAVYRKILEAKVVFPQYVTPAARDLILGLLDRNRTSRLGFGGIGEIMRHPFFADVDWTDVEERRTKPPFVPKQPGGEGASEIDTDKDEESDGDAVVLRPYKHLKTFRRDNIHRF